MSRIVYNDGEFMDERDAFVPLMDRSFLFGDGIYEVTCVIGGRLIDNEPHLARLDRSLREIDIPNPLGADAWTGIQQELIRRNALDEGLVYLQVSRGVADRDYLSPDDLKPRVIMFTQAKSIVNGALAQSGAAILTVPDQRWARRDIKSVALLAQVMAKRAARAAGANEAWMIEDDFVTEGASSTAFIVTSENEIVTRPLSHAVLPGVTRLAVMRLVAEKGLKLVERPFSLAEAHAAREAFYTSAGSLVTPIVSIDGVKVGDGMPGPTAKALRSMYLDLALASER
ncbi:MAG: D-amino-acid transaminase [Beijerinckiaceae bacterium]|nr:D-amino-acid transaminase [Beijerinckiaceae bacterium]